MNKLILALLFAPALATAQVQVQAGASFTLDLPVIIPPMVVIQPGIQVVPDVDFEVFHVDGYYWTQREGRWYRSGNPRAGWAYMSRGVPPGLTRLPPGHYKRWKGKPARGPAFGVPVRGGPGPVLRGGDHHERHDDDHGGGKKHGKKHGKHD